MAYSSYYTYQKYVKYQGQDPLPVVPITYSVDADGTMPLMLKNQYDPNCGWTGSTEPIYRWYDMPNDYICDECPECINGEGVVSIKYTVVGTICINGDKYERLRLWTREGNCVNNDWVYTEWEEADPEEDTYGKLIEMDSPDCQ